MQKDDLLMKKQSFIKSRRQNILHFYDFDPKVLGKGAYGVVYKAKDKTTGSWRAVKKISKRNLKDSQLLQNQISILKYLDHPSCIKLYETFEDQTNFFFVTDLCQGGQIFDRLDSDGNFSEQDARKIFIQILQAISYCHSHKICHRDIKPQNFLFVSKDSLDIKIIDFGLAYRWNQNMKSQIQAKGEKRLFGTAYYIAPQILSGSYNQSCDIWSVGIMLYVLLSAVPPFDGQNDKAIIQQVRKMKYNIDIPQMKNVSRVAKDLIQKILVPQNKRLSLKEIFSDPWILKQAAKCPLKLAFNKLQNFTQFSKLKKIAATYIATQLQQKQIQHLGSLFKQIDLDHDGQISIQQLKQSLKDEKNTPSIKDLANVMNGIDTDKNGRINYNEFLASTLDVSKLFKQERMKQFFRMIDKNNDGYIEKAQLAELFVNYGISTHNGKSVQQIMQQCDKDGNGVIDYNQFKSSLLS